MSTIRIAGFVNDSVVDGEGYRYSIFVQGCPHNCEGCHNPQTHDFSSGTEWEKEALLAKVLDDIDENILLTGVTFSGGEPFCQAEILAELAELIHKRGMDIWCYTGFTLEVLQEKAETEPAIGKLLNGIDVLVDGPFVMAERNLELSFRGSNNQRVIDMRKTRQKGEIVLWGERPGLFFHKD